MEVSVHGPIKTMGDINNSKESNYGMVLDFDDLKEYWKPIHERLDHSYLNESLKYEIPVTTVEYLSCWIFNRLQPLINMSERCTTKLYSIRVWETETSSATVYAKDF